MDLTGTRVRLRHRGETVQGAIKQGETGTLVTVVLDAGGTVIALLRELEVIQTTIWVAECTTRHFDFLATGHTQDEAHDSLKAGLEVHSRDYPDADLDWLRSLLDPDNGDVNYYEVTVPGCLRDGALIA